MSQVTKFHVGDPPVLFGSYAEAETMGGTLASHSKQHDSKTACPPYMVVSQNQGYLIGVPYTQDSSILGCMLGFPFLGSPFLRKLPCRRSSRLLPYGL